MTRPVLAHLWQCTACHLAYDNRPEADACCGTSSQHPTVTLEPEPLPWWLRDA